MHQNRTTQQERREFYRSVFALVLPMAAQNLINVAVTSADVIMLGKVGETVLSASSLAGQVQFIMTLIFFGLTSGAAVLTAQYWGKKDTRTIEKVMGMTMRYSVLAAIIFTVIVALFPTQIMRIFTPEPDVIAHGAQYLQIICLSYVMMAITTVYLNIMRSVERVMISTIVYSVSLCSNILINAVLIFGLFGFPQLGIRGAAIGTLISRAIELIIVVCYSRKKDQRIHWRLSDLFVKDKDLLSDFLRYATPVTLNELLWGAATSTNALIIGHMGSAAVAANSVAQVTRQLATVIAFGIATATAIMLGKLIGSGDTGKAERYGHLFVKLTWITSGAGAILILIISPIAAANLSLSETAKGYLGFMMFVMAYFSVFQSYNTTMIVGVFRAGGDTKFGLFLDIATMWGGSILLGTLAAFVFHLPVPVVYVLLTCDELIKIPFTTKRYRSKVWLRDVTR